MGIATLEKSNFEFLKLKPETSEWYQKAQTVEKLYADGDYSTEIQAIRPIAESMVRLIADLSDVPKFSENTFADNLRAIKRLTIDKKIINYLYQLKEPGNEASHTTENFDKKTGQEGLIKIFIVLRWFMVHYAGVKVQEEFFEPEIKENIYSTSERKIIYVWTADNENGNWPNYEGAQKVGDTKANGSLRSNWGDNSTFLQGIASDRIRQYATTSGIPFKAEWVELALKDDEKTWFRDYEVHEVLKRSGVKHKNGLAGKEWFNADLETVKRAIQAVREGRSAIDVTEEALNNDIVLRPEQQEAIKQTEKVFKNNSRMLWNAKMRFGKTLTALQLIKNEQFNKVLIMTHRPVVSDSWFDDFNKIKMEEKDYRYGSKHKGESLNNLVKQANPFVYFASMQDLRGSEQVGGKQGLKNDLIFQTAWDLVIIDEAHEGTQTELAHNVLEAVTTLDTKVLELSGTPFNLIDQYDEESIYTWDYVMEQRAKAQWEIDHPEIKNPYEGLPKVSMYTFEMNHKDKYNDGLKSFNFKEFFRVNDEGHFVHEDDVNGFLNEITTYNSKTNYPYSTQEFRDELRHTLWLLPGVKEAKALKNLMEQHPIFGKEYNIVNVVDNGDETIASDNDLQRVRSAIGRDASQTKTITLTVRKLTTGVNVAEWTAVMFLSNTNSATQYLQAAFRAQTPYSDRNGIKANAYIFDFAPDRALTVMASSANLSTNAGKLNEDGQKQEMGQLLNFLPIIGTSGNGMHEYNVDKLLEQVKRVFAEKAVQSGFDDDSLYSDELLMNINEQDLTAFNDLKSIVGKTKSEKAALKVDVNNQGLTEEEYERAKRGDRKSKRKRTNEEEEALNKLKEQRKQSKTMISILRGISIRIPMMIYGMKIDIDEDVDIQTFIQNVDEQSWQEFMPKGVTKDKFKQFIKYYDPEIFVEAGRIIRNKVKELDVLGPIERAQELAVIFSTFKNPDKETVLTPWRVVNMHLGKTIGGLSYFDDEFLKSSEGGVSAVHWLNTDITKDVFKGDTHILEINSKTGLYPLYVATSLYKLAFDKMNEENAGKFTAEDEEKLWQEILSKNIYVMAKTPMAKTITERTLSGYRNYKMNVEFVDGIVEDAKIDINQAVQKIEEVFNHMKFDVVIGNPPYQEANVGDNKQATPIYHLFMQMSEKLAEKSTLITPARFLFNPGRNLESFSNAKLHDEHFKVIKYEPSSNFIFPRTDIKGGVLISLFDKTKKFTPIEVFTTHPELRTILKKVGPIDNIGKIVYSPDSYRLSELMFSERPDLIGRTDMSHAKAMSSSVFKRYVEVFHDDISKENDDYIKIFGRENNTRVFKYIKRKYVVDHPNLDKWKIFVPGANGSGHFGETLSKPIIGEPGVGHNQTFMSIGNFETDLEAHALLKYVTSKFGRTMLGILKVTQNNQSKTTWGKVPLQNFTNTSDIDWEQNLSNIDQQLYDKYGLDDNEINFIEQNVKPMN